MEPESISPEDPTNLTHQIAPLLASVHVNRKSACARVSDNENGTSGSSPSLADGVILFADQEDDPVIRAAEVYGKIIEKLWKSDMLDQFDQQPNLKEMLRYMECLRDCRTRDDVMELLEYLKPTVETGLTGLSMAAAGNDMRSDFIGLIDAYAAGGVGGGVTFTFLCSVFIYILSMVIGIVRISFIGKEAYNLRKALILGLTDEFDIEPYKYQGIIDFWQGKWLNSLGETGRGFLELIKNVLDKIFFTISFLWLSILGRPIPIPNASRSNLHASLGNIVMNNQELQDLIQLIDEECMPALPVFWTLHATSIPLNYRLIKQTRKLAHRCKDDRFWINREQVLRILVQATFLHFIRFQSAEVTKTELFVETIPQLILRTTYSAQSLINRGLVSVFTDAGWIDRAVSVAAFFSPPIQLVLSTLKKMEYYFALYRQGQNFFKKGVYQEEGEGEQTGVKIMPTYSIPQKGFCIFAHALTMGPLIFLAALTCSSVLGPLPLLILIVTFSYVFWRASDIPLYNWYYTWTCTLSTLCFSRKEFDINRTITNLISKWFAFLISNVVIFTVLSLGSEFSSNLFSLFKMHASLIILYLFGSFLQYLERLWFKKNLGKRNYNIYIDVHKD